MNNALQRIESILSRLSMAPRNDRRQAIALWNQFRQEVIQSPPSENDVIAGIIAMLEMRDWRLGEPLLVMAGHISSHKLAPLMCKILDLGDPAAPIENAIEILRDLKDPRSVPSLILATQFRYPFDAGLQIPIKAIEALCEIGTEEAFGFVDQVILKETGLLSEEAKSLRNTSISE